MSSARRSTLGVLAWLTLAAGGAAALEVPYLGGRVVDLADMLDDAAESRLDQRLAALERAEGHQVAVLTVPSLEGDSIEDFSLRVVETWKLGRQGQDDGVLLLLARDDRKMRIEVGYGLEATLTDAMSSRILNDVMRPRLRAGDVAGGIEAGSAAIVGVIEGDADALPPPSAEGGGGQPARGRVGAFLVFLLVAGAHAMAAVFNRGCMTWFLYLFLAPFWAVFPAMLVGRTGGLVMLGLWLVGFPIAWVLLHRTAAGQAIVERRRTARRRGRSWTSTGGWSGGFSSGGFSGGGFSGGGGSFGGGGSSSSW